MSDELDRATETEVQNVTQGLESVSARGSKARRHRDPLGGMISSLILIWVGLVCLASNVGQLDGLPRGLEGSPWNGGSPVGVWSLVFLGAGGIILLEVVIRAVCPIYR